MNHTVSAPFVSNIFRKYYCKTSITVTKRSAAWIRGRSHAGIAGSSHASAWLEPEIVRFVCCQLDVPVTGRSSSGGVWVKCVWVLSQKLKKWGGPDLSRAVATQERNYGKTQHVFLARELGDWIHNRVYSDTHNLQICSTGIWFVILVVSL